MWANWPTLVNLFFLLLLPAGFVVACILGHRGDRQKNVRGFEVKLITGAESPVPNEKETDHG